MRLTNLTKKTLERKQAEARSEAFDASAQIDGQAATNPCVLLSRGNGNQATAAIIIAAQTKKCQLSNYKCLAAHQQVTASSGSRALHNRSLDPQITNREMGACEVTMGATLLYWHPALPFRRIDHGTFALVS